MPKIYLKFFVSGFTCPTHSGHSAELAELSRCWNQEDGRDCRRGKMLLVLGEPAWTQTDLALHHLHKRNRGTQGLLSNVRHGSHSYCPFPFFFIASKLFYLTSFCEAFPNPHCNRGILLANCALFFYTALLSRFSYFPFCSTVCSQIIYFLFLLFLHLQQRFLLLSLILLSPWGEELESFFQCTSPFSPESWSSETSEKLMMTTSAVQVPSDEFYWQCHGPVGRK